MRPAWSFAPARRLKGQSAAPSISCTSLMQASPALFSTDFPSKVEAPATIITTTASDTPPQESLGARKALRPARSLKADRELDSAGTRSGRKHHEREISPEATPMTKGGSLACKQPGKHCRAMSHVHRHSKKGRIARTLRDTKRRSR